MATLLFVNSFRISTCREKNLGGYYEAEVGRREAEEPTIDDLVRYIEGDTQTSSNKKKKSNKAKKSGKISPSDQAPAAPSNSARKDKLKETRAVPKKTTHSMCEDDTASVSALEADPDDDATQPKPAERLIHYLVRSISEKEAELECPVCLRVVEAGAAVFSCQQQHLLCAACRPRVTECPECREKFSQPPVRHRWAEKMAGDLHTQRRELAAQLEQFY